MARINIYRQLFATTANFPKWYY